MINFLRPTKRKMFIFLILPVITIIGILLVVLGDYLITKELEIALAGWPLMYASLFINILEQPLLVVIQPVSVFFWRIIPAFGATELGYLLWGVCGYIFDIIFLYVLSCILSYISWGRKKVTENKSQNW